MKKQIKVSGIDVFCSHTEIVETDSLKPNPRNTNRHPEGQITLLAKIIKEQGWRNPIVVSERSGLIVKGHARLMAAQELGLKEVPVDYQPYKDKASEFADMIADNRIAELADMDMDLTKELLSELKSGGMDLDLAGYNPDIIKHLLADINNPGSVELNEELFQNFKNKCPKCGFEWGENDKSRNNAKDKV